MASTFEPGGSLSIRAQGPSPYVAPTLAQRLGFDSQGTWVVNAVILGPIVLLAAGAYVLLRRTSKGKKRHGR